MGRLRALGSSLTTLRPSIAFLPQGEQERDKARASLPWRQLYNSARWRKLAAIIKRRDRYTCQRPECGHVGGKLIVDHKRPHRGDEALFFDEENLWTLCKPCHDGWKQKRERRGLA